MLASARFANPRVVSTSPHPGEVPGRKCGNRTYCFAEAPVKPVPLSIVDDAPLRCLDARPRSAEDFAL
jgi:hypothetical protein